ncbi:MAG: AraC family transcriptional regulator [Planctomycetota bacterium]
MTDQTTDSVSVGRIDDVRITVAGGVVDKREWVHSRFEGHALGLVTRGRGRYRVGAGRWQTIGPGSLFAVYPGPVFHYGPEEGTGWSETHLGGIGPGVERWCRYGWIATDGVVRRLPRAGLTRWVEGVAELHGLAQSGRPGDSDRAVLFAERLMLEMSLAVVSGRDDSGRASRRWGPDGVGAALAGLPDRLGGPIDWEELSAEFGVSYSLLRKRVREQTGLSPGKYLARLRCHAACRLLGSTDLSIGRIAEAVGITDVPTFSRLFKRTLGVTATGYRRDQRRLGVKHAGSLR